MTPSAALRAVPPAVRLAIALALLSAAGLALAEAAPRGEPGGAPPPGDAPPPGPRLLPLPRSSIAAVLARRSALGLDDRQVAALEARDEALARETAELRNQLTAPPERAGGKKEGSGFNFNLGPGQRGGEGAKSGGGERGGMGAGGGSGGGMGGGPGGGRGGHPQGERRAKVDPAERAAALQHELDDADTAAWLEAEALLPARLRDPARAVAAAYREALADKRAARPPEQKR